MPSKIKVKAEPDGSLQVQINGKTYTTAPSSRAEGRIDSRPKQDPESSANDPPPAKRKSPSSENNDDAHKGGSEGIHKRQRTQQQERSVVAPSVVQDNETKDKTASRPLPSAGPKSKTGSRTSSRSNSRQTSPRTATSSTSQTPMTTPLVPLESLTYANPSVALPPPNFFLPHDHSQGMISPLAYLPPPPPTPPKYPEPPSQPQVRLKGEPYPSRVIQQQAEKMMEVIKDEVLSAWQTMKVLELKKAVNSAPKGDAVSEGVQTDVSEEKEDLNSQNAMCDTLLNTMESERRKHSEELKTLKDENARLKVLTDKLELTIVKLEAKLESSARQSIEKLEFDAKLKKHIEITERLRGIIKHLDPEGKVTVTEEGFGVYSSI
ncbi:hypothetical protein CVT26_012813 [Gymnopilus dilepis]|uniref:Uncharacterized protein n=1 Tax=Gymnopilus dilepis TaxID=231916 RepID=A0A409WDJ3_9AGAR|nr:hypothetical protein CVT26_012813 [Gymnopilus dilepis]